MGARTRRVFRWQNTKTRPRWSRCRRVGLVIQGQRKHGCRELCTRKLLRSQLCSYNVKVNRGAAYSIRVGASIVFKTFRVQIQLANAELGRT